MLQNKKDNVTMAISGPDGEIATVNGDAFDRFIHSTNDQDSNITIKKAKIKDKMFLEAEYSEELPEHGTKTTKLSCTVTIHKDLDYSFNHLRNHLAILCDEVSLDDIGYAEAEDILFSGFGVRSFTIGGTDDFKGVVISGYKKGRYGIVNLNTPFVKFEDSDYRYIDILKEDIDSCIHEVKQYLFHGKKAPDIQLEIPFSEMDESDKI